MLSTPARHAIEMTLAACYDQDNEVRRAANIVACAKTEGLRDPSTSRSQEAQLMSRVNQMQLIPFLA